MTQLPTRNAFTFDGKSEYLDFGNPKAFSFSDQLTIESWIKPQIHNNKNCLFTKGIKGFNLFFKWDQLLLDYNPKNRSKTKLSSGAWHHIAVSYNPALRGNNIKIYIDGKLDNAFNENKLDLSNQKNFVIGRDQTNQFNLFKGELAYFVVWNTERHPWQILQDKNLHIDKDDSSLVLLLTMQDTDNKTLQDSSANQIHGTLFSVGSDSPQSIQKSNYVTYDYQLKSPLFSALKDTLPSSQSGMSDGKAQESIPVSQLTKRSGEITKLINRINQHGDSTIAQKRLEIDHRLRRGRINSNQQKLQAHHKADELLRLSNVDSIFFSKKGALMGLIPRITDFNPTKDTNLIAYYPLQEDAQDKSGNNLHGTATDQVNFIEEKDGKCAEFAIEGANIQLPPFKETYDQFTASFWFKLNPYKGDEKYDPKNGDMGRNIIRGISAVAMSPYLQLSIRYYWLESGAATIASPGGNIAGIHSNSEAWHHIALTVSTADNKGIYTVYCDGQKYHTYNENLRLDRPFTKPFYFHDAISIGGSYQSQYTNKIHWTEINNGWSPRTIQENCDLLDGYVKEAFFFDRDLSADEVQLLYKLQSDKIIGPFAEHKYHFDDLFINDFAADLGNHRILLAGLGAGNGIYSFNTESQALSLEIKTDQSPSAICFDDINRIIYWIEGLSQIWRFKSEENKKEKILDLDKNSLDFPNQIKVDTKASVLIWCSSSGIWRSDLEGDHIKCLVYRLEAPSPVGMTLDVDHQRIFWIDSELKKIRQTDYSGNTIIDLYSVVNPLGGMTYTPDPSKNSDQREDYLYWNEKTIEPTEGKSVQYSARLCYGKADGSSEDLQSTPFSGDCRFIVNTKSQESILEAAKAYTDLKKETLKASQKIEDAHQTAQNELQTKNSELIKTQANLDEKIKQKNEEHLQIKADNQQALNQATLTTQKKILDAKAKVSRNLADAQTSANQIKSDAQTKAQDVKNKAQTNYNKAKKERDKY